MDRQDQADDATFRRHMLNQHDNEYEHDHDHDHNDDEHSPESAGLARGLARSAASRSAVGRLPVSSARAGGSVAKAAARNSMRVRPRATMPKPPSMAGKMKMRGGGAGAGAAGRVRVPTPKGNVSAAKSAPHANRSVTKAVTPRGAGRVNARRIARASDRASTGLDLVEAASSEEGLIANKTETQKQGFVARAKENMRRVPAFMTTLAKNTVLGMAVFATYEGVVECEFPSSPSYSSPDDKNDDIASSDPFAAASLSRHTAAGFLAGTAHAGVSYTMDGVVRMRRTIFNGGTKGVVIAPPSPFFLHAMHHSISHSVLFGSYEGLKRCLISSFGAGDDSCHRSDGDQVEGDYTNLFAIGLAGGCAGTAQHVVSEYTETAFVTSYAKFWQNDLTLMKRLKLLSKIVPVPSLRALAMAFIPSSIGFVAFEYGKELMQAPSELDVEEK